MTDKLHNNFFVTTFSDKGVMTDLITQLLPEVAIQIEIESLELDSTSYVDEQLNDLYSDIVYSCKGKNGNSLKVALLFEHKSNPAAYPRFQLLDYILGIWRQNLKNKEKLTFVIPVIFYHGKTQWKYRDLFDYFDKITEAQKAYIPNFKYHLIDLTQYSDEKILSLKTSFLINSLIAFKHKNDSDYVRKHGDRIYYKIEIYSDSDYKQLFIKTLTAYIMASSKMDAQEILEMVETLEKSRQGTVKSTLENLIDLGKQEGLKQGLEQGTTRGDERKSIYVAIDSFEMGFEIAIIHRLSKVAIVVLELLKANIDSEFKVETKRNSLATALIQHFEYLNTRDIMEFCQMKKEEVEILKENLKSE